MRAVRLIGWLAGGTAALVLAASFGCYTPNGVRGLLFFHPGPLALPVGAVTQVHWSATMPTFTFFSCPTVSRPPGPVMAAADDDAVVAVDDTGVDECGAFAMLRALAPGRTIIRVVEGAVRDELEIFVSTPTHITLSPTALDDTTASLAAPIDVDEVHLGTAVNLIVDARLRDASGAPLAFTEALVVTSDDESVVSVEGGVLAAMGLLSLRGVAAGTTTIRCAAHGVDRELAVIVDP
jgi:hypothetical protein